MRRWWRTLRVTGTKMTRRTKKKKRTIINGISQLWIKSLDGPKMEEKLNEKE